MILSMEFGVYESQQVDLSKGQINEKHISVLQKLYGFKQEVKDQLLTDREQEVLHLIAMGYMNKEFADKHSNGGGCRGPKSRNFIAAVIGKAANVS